MSPHLWENWLTWVAIGFTFTAQEAVNKLLYSHPAAETIPSRGIWSNSDCKVLRGFARMIALVAHGVIPVPNR